MNYVNISTIKYKKNQSFFQKVLHILYSQRKYFHPTETSPSSNLFNSKHIYYQDDKLAHSLKMSTRHFLKALPSHKLKNEGTSVIFNRPYLLISTGHLKDLISSLATIEALQQKVAGASIDVLVRQGNESLLDNHPVIREILIWNPDKSGKHIRTKINAFIRKQNYQTIYATSNNQLTKAILKGIKKEIIRTFDSQWKKYFGFKGNYYPEGEKLSNRWAAFGKIASASYQTSSPAYYLTAKELKNSSPLKGNKFSLLLLDKKDLTNKQAEIKDVLDSIPDENAIYQWSRYPWKHPRLPGSRTVLNLSGKLGLLEIIDLLRSGDSFSFNEEYDLLTHWIKPE